MIDKILRYKRILAAVCLLLTMVFITYWVLLDKKIKQEQGKTLTEKLEKFLPEEAKNKVYVKHDLKTTKYPLVSTVFTVSQDKEKQVEGIILEFMKQTQKTLEEEGFDYSALTITVLTLNNYEQYRVVLGKEVLDRFKDLNKETILKDLTDYCPKTNPEHLMEFCNLTPNLRKE